MSGAFCRYAVFLLVRGGLPPTDVRSMGHWAASGNARTVTGGGAGGGPTWRGSCPAVVGGVVSLATHPQPAGVRRSHPGIRFLLPAWRHGVPARAPDRGRATDWFFLVWFDRGLAFSGFSGGPRHIAWSFLVPPAGGADPGHHSLRAGQPGRGLRQRYRWPIPFHCCLASNNRKMRKGIVV